MDKSKVYLEVPEFTGENVPVAVAARVMKRISSLYKKVQLIKLIREYTGSDLKEAKNVLMKLKMEMVSL